MMNNGKMTAIARPYAAAAFEWAAEKQDIAAWSSMLQTAAQIVEDRSVAKLLMSPHVTSGQLITFFCEMLRVLLNPERSNFIWLLANNGRLSVLPDIAALFQSLCAAQDKTLAVQVVSAVSLDEVYQQKLAKTLTERLQRQVTLQCEIDPTLLGGILIRAGDRVFDGSVRGKLTRLFEFL